MLHELALRPRQNYWATAALKALRPRLADVQGDAQGFGADDLAAVLDTIIDNYADDDARITDVSELLFGVDLVAYGARATAVFNRWADEGGGPSMVAMAAHAIDHFNIPHDHPDVGSVLTAALLAEYPNNLLYHGNEHYRKVMFHVIRLMVTHQALQDEKAIKLSEAQIIQMLIAAAIHDLGHEGGDNMRDGIYTPGYMEQRAVDIARPYFQALDLDRDLLAEIETIVFCTDITFFAGENSPCVRMRKIFDYFFVGNVTEDDIGMMMIGKLRRFDENPALSMMAMLLHEADVGSSAGLSYEQSRVETMSIMEERGVMTAGPKMLLAFMTQQLNGNMVTPAGRAVFGPAMQTIMEQAAEEIANGVETF